MEALRSESGVPIQYLCPLMPFGPLALSIRCRAPILIPRPETEQWVSDLLIPHISQHKLGRPLRVLDLCTGTGCIGLAAAATTGSRQAVQVTAVDIDPRAVVLSKENALHNQVKNIDIIQGDIFDKDFLTNVVYAENWDILTCNPAYISLREYRALDVAVREHESCTALLAEQNGLAFYHQLAKIIQHPAFSNARVFFEIGSEQGQAVRDIFNGQLSDISIWKDFSNQDRVITGRRPGISVGTGTIGHRRSFHTSSSSESKSSSSGRWLARQRADPYVVARPREGYRSRSAFKLSQLNDRFKFLKPGRVVVDLGGAPGGWSQVASAKVGARGIVVCIDLLSIEPLERVSTIQADFLHAKAQAALMDVIHHHLQTRAEANADYNPQRAQSPQDRQVDIVLSDMAPSFSGQKDRDEANCRDLYDAAIQFATLNLRYGRGVFVMKHFAGNDAAVYRKILASLFKSVIYDKPDSSRSGSGEGFWICQGLLGPEE